MTALQRSKRQRRQSRHLAACMRDEKRRVRKLNRRRARVDPYAIVERIDNRNIT